MGAVVLDASALVEILLGAAITPFDRFLDPDLALHVPEVCDVEVVAGLRRRVARGLASELDVWDALVDYIDLPITRHSHFTMIGRMFELRANFTPYDAAYVALAERLGADLVTADRSLARAVHRHTAVRCMP